MRTKKPKIGRPAGKRPAGTDSPRVTVQVRVSDHEAAAFTARSKSLHLLVSEWLRILARRDCGLFPTDDPTEPLQPS